MAWLFPAVLSSLIGSTLLSAAYGYLYYAYRKKFLALWFLAWGAHALRYVFVLIILVFGNSPGLKFAHLSMILISLYFLYTGTVEFINKKVSRLWQGAFILVLAWTALAVIFNFTFLTLTIPLFGFFACVHIWVGYNFLRSDFSTGIGKKVVGITFIVWGLHRADYPFLRPVEWFAPFGYIIGATCAIVIALGMLILFFERMRSELDRQKTQLRQMFNEASYGIAVADPDTGTLVDCNAVFADMVKRDKDEIIGMQQKGLHSIEEHTGDFSNTFKQHLEKKSGQTLESKMVTPAGEIIDVEIKSALIDFGYKKYLQGFFKDITEKKRAEVNQDLLTRRLEALWKISSLKNADLKTICDTILDEITQMTGSSYGFYGFLDEAETAMNIHSWSSHTMADCAIHKKPIVFTIEQSGVWGNAVRDRKPFLLNDYRESCANKKGLPEGHVGLTRVLAVPVFDNDKIIALAAVANKPTDYTDQDLQQLDVFLSNVQIIIDQKRAEDEKIELEMQLQQAQKIESIGHLAGGVAHDFNNMLGVIIGHTELALRKADPDNPFIGDLEGIRTAALRSADLTRQLLTFARKEAITPKTLDLNDTLAGMLKMLQRLIGENIHLSWNPGPNLWASRIDPSQLDQILANLCVNARDAIGGIGKIVIETQNCSIAEGGLKTDPEAQPGDYVCLSVSDNGHGVDQKLLDQIFEPFFTTKEFGQGTGLGLATVFGAVKQNKGLIEVVSQPGQGTTFHIYLPRQQANVEPMGEKTAQPLGQGMETVLLVEDDQMLLELTKTMLEENGYKVLDASTSNAAITLAKDHSEPIHLLLSDLIMPEMNGKDLRDRLLAIRPEMKVVFMSGYTADIIAQQGEIEEGTHFLQKPVSLETLTSKVRKVLDQD